MQRWLVMTATRRRYVSVYERTRRWGNGAGTIRIGIRVWWNRAKLQCSESELSRLRLIALEHGLDRNPH
jgi:hypothetical protein